jgi:fibronectin type 3 domain-containing protein
VRWLVPVVAGATLLALSTPATAKPAPDTTITSGPAALTSATGAQFGFSSTVGGSTFRCSLDGATPASCTSPVTYSGLAVGSHNFTVAATANAITDSSPATATWTIDQTPPTAPSALTGSAASQTAVALGWTPGTDATGVTANQILRDGSLLATIGAVSAYNDATVTAGSTHSYAVRAVDGAGNLSPLSASVAVTTPLSQPAPDTVIDSQPPALAESTSAAFSFHATISGATFSCSLDGGRSGSCTSPRSYTGLAQGPHKFSVAATVSGVTDTTPATATWTVDTVAPTVPGAVTASVSGPTSVTVTWTASSDAVGVTSYDVFRDGSLLASVGAVTPYIDSTVTTGSTHRYAVRANDGAGNSSALSAASLVVVTAAYDPHLTRAPYLTDLVGLHVAINFATDQSATTGSIQYGAVDGAGNCTPSTTVTAGRITILVGTVSEYQWTAQVTLPATGTYCYRAYLASTDLLAGNGSPRFTTQVPFGSTSGFTFAVLGDWGQVDANGDNVDQANLMAQIAGSGARFAVTVGDNGYPNGNQINYGDLQQKGADTSAIFGPPFWTVPGASIPIFNGVGNHGLSGVAHTDITTWTQATAVSTSGGRYQNDVYCCVNGSTSSNYGSEWYAFDAGNARFYVLDSAWGDTNGGTANPYANDALAHFAPGTPEYTWLLADLQSHPTQLKFAFSHFPLYSDNNTQGSDTYLQGATNLEGLLGSNGVQIVFNGHAHIYERNTASATGMPITYVTGGGGATLEPMGTCNVYDAYAIGWSPTTSTGSTCGSARAPTAASAVYHYLKVTVSGTSVTVTPTDSLGNTFDVRTYTFKVPPDTYLDSTPPAGTTTTTATFAFHASGSPATFSCRLDAGTATACTSPVTYTGLGEGSHSFTVTATVGKQVDPTPAHYTWTVDHTSPAAPTGLSGSASTPFQVDLNWSAATDNTGVTGYRVYRDGAFYRSLGSVTSFSDAVLGSSTHAYTVTAVDVAGNESLPSGAVTVTTPDPPVPLFQDGFESGDLTAWTSSAGLTVETSTVNSGSYAAEASTTNGNTFAKKTLPSTYPDGYSRVLFDVVSQSAQINLLRLRDTAGNSIGYVYVDTTGRLGFHNDTLGTNTLSQVLSSGWHAVELRMAADTTAGTATGVVQVWLDNLLVGDLSSTAVDVGAEPIGSIQIGEVQAGRAYDVVFDDAAFGTSRLGPQSDSAAPNTPTGLAATAVSPFAVQLGWDAPTDDTTGYTVYRDGILLTTVGVVSGFYDSSVLAGSTYAYSVSARDAAGNVSPLTSTVGVTTPASQPPVFADGFENGDLSNWTSKSGLVVQAGDVRSGGFAADASTSAGATWAKLTLPADYSDGYARVAFLVKSQSAQLTLLRLRNTPTGTGGYLYLTATGRLAFRSDALTAGTVSSVAPGPGWHALELHLVIAGAVSSVQTWLDGSPVPDLTFQSIDLGTSPMGVLQIGDTTASGAWDVVFDDAAFGTSRLGPVGDVTAPSVPQNLTASAPSAFSVSLSWDASSDNMAVAGYDVFRDGSLLTAGVSTTGYVDSSVLASTTHDYTVRARDTSANVSAFSSDASVSTPAATAPVFANGFETGDLSGWTSAGGLVVKSTDVFTGAYGAEASTTTGATYAKRTLPSTYDDGYARVAFLVKSQVSQINLLRLRAQDGTSLGYLYLDTSGRLALHVDAAGTNTVSTVVPGAGWHVAELHMTISAGIVEVWLDGVAVTALSVSGGVLGSAAIGALQIGETTTGRTYDVVFDDGAFGLGRIGVS